MNKPLLLMVIFSLLSGLAYGSFQVACRRVNTGITQDKLLIIIYLMGLLFIGANILRKMYSPPIEDGMPAPAAPSANMMILGVVFLSVVAYSGDKFAVMANFLPGADPVAITGIIALAATMAMGMEWAIEKAPPNRYHVLGCVMVIITALTLAKGGQVYEAERAARAELTAKATESR